MSNSDFVNDLDGLVRGVEDVVHTVEHGVEHVVDEVAGALSGSGSDTPMEEIRWEGMSNAQLASAVKQLTSGSGASAMTEAADALANVAADLSTINQTLQTQMQAIGVNWQSQTASELANQMLSSSSAYGGSVTDQGGQASSSMSQQAEAYATARNGAPQPETLLGNAGGGSSLISKVGSGLLTNHGTDQTPQASQTNAARSQAIDTLSNYTSSSQTNLAGYTPPPPAPAIGLHTQTPPSAPSGGTSVSGYVPPSGGGAPVGVTAPGGVSTLPPTGVGGGGGGGTLPPTIGGGAPGFPGLPGGGSTGVPISGGASGLGFPGGGGISGGVPSGGAGGVSGGVPGGLSGGSPAGGGFTGGAPGGGSATGLPPGSANLPTGPISGIGNPAGPGSASSGAAMPGAGAAGGLSEDIGDLAAGAAVAGGSAAVGIVGANAQGDRVVRGNNDPAGFADDEDDFAPRSGVGEFEEAEQAANAARISAQLAPEDPVPAFFEPMGGGNREDDDQHRRTYGAEDEDFFGDDRTVAPDVFGGEEPDGDGKGA